MPIVQLWPARNYGTYHRQAMIRPLFIIGNKRSGTSQLVRILNLHPQVFVSHESDIAWILHQWLQDRPLVAHEWDSDRGLRTTLAAGGHLLRRDATPLANYQAVQLALMEKGTPWLPAQQKPEVLWVGDKKPMQHTDPAVLAFLLQHFPEARFLHIVRHPFVVAASSDRFNETADGDFWLGLSTGEKVERWAYHEEQVRQLREKLPARVHTLRYEDLCRHTERELAGVFQFLQLTPDPAVLREAARQTHPLPRPIPPLPCSPAATRIAADYGYDLRHPPGRFRVLAENVYWRLAKKLRF